MKRLFTLNEIDLIKDILEYVNIDDKERNDFIEQFGDSYFNGNGELMIDGILNDSIVKGHIFYKTSVLLQNFSKE